MRDITPKEAAKLFVAAFESFQRNASPDTIWKLKDGSPEWITEAARAAHGNMFPDDVRYEMIRETAQDLADSDDWDDIDETLDSSVDVYNAQLLRWVASHLSRASYVEDVVKEGLVSLKDFEFFRALMAGQFREREEIASFLIEAFNARAETGEDEDDAPQGGAST